METNTTRPFYPIMAQSKKCVHTNTKILIRVFSHGQAGVGAIDKRAFSACTIHETRARRSCEDQVFLL